MKPANVRTWSGCKSAQIIDMTNAGRRGKTCSLVRYWPAYTAAAEAAAGELVRYLNEPETMSAGFDAILAGAEAIRARYPGDLNREEYMIRGVDAPAEPLAAGVAGIWSAEADENGLHLADLTDHNNEPREITDHRQSPSEAYRRAARVWPQVAASKTLRQAREILESAGCRLHHYCAMD